MASSASQTRKRESPEELVVPNYCDNVESLILRITKNAFPHLNMLKLSAGCEARYVDPDIFAEAVSKVSKVDLEGAKITTDQINELFHLIVHSSPSEYKLQVLNLSKIELSCGNLSGIDANHLGKAVIRLKEIDLGDTKLSTHQCKKLFEYIGRKNSKLEVLHMEGVLYRHLDFNEIEVDGNLLSRAIVRLKAVHIGKMKPSIVDALLPTGRIGPIEVGTGLTSSQITKICNEVIENKNSTLEELHVGFTDFTGVNASLLGQALASLIKVNIREARITPQQLDTFFKFIIQGSPLNYLDLSGIHLAGVDQSLYRKVKGKVSTVLEETYGPRIRSLRYHPVPSQ